MNHELKSNIKKFDFIPYYISVQDFNVHLTIKNMLHFSVASFSQGVPSHYLVRVGLVLQYIALHHT